MYFGMLPIDPANEEAMGLIPYTRGMLDALGMTHGPSCGKIILTADGACIIEMNCRAYIGDENWVSLSRALCGSKYCEVLRER